MRHPDFYDCNSRIGKYLGKFMHISHKRQTAYLQIGWKRTTKTHQTRTTNKNWDLSRLDEPTAVTNNYFQLVKMSNLLAAHDQKIFLGVVNTLLLIV